MITCHTRNPKCVVIVLPSKF